VLIPIGDEPHEPGTAWVNHGLIAANVLVMLLVGGWAATPEFVETIERWGYRPSAPRVETLFTSMFLHAGLMHLGGNMLFLWIFGDNVEARLGHGRYLLAYLATGAAGTLAFGLLHPGGTDPLVGASGAISGVQGMYFLGFPRNRVKLLVFFVFVLQVIHVPARWIIGFWFVVNDLLPMLGRQVTDNVAHAAHLGGFAAGVVAYLLLRPWLRAAEERSAGIARGSATDFAGAGRGWLGNAPDPYAGGRTRPPPEWSGAGAPPAAVPPEEAILALWRGGRFTEAAALHAQRLALGRAPSLPEAESFRLAVYLYERGQFDDARRAFHAFADAHPRSRNVPAASYALGMIYARRDRDAVHARPFLEHAMRAHPDANVREHARRELEDLRR
jgi:membrane associated rhomboid family serine protease